MDRSWVMGYWLIDRRWRNSVRSIQSGTRTGLPSDHAPLVLQLAGKFAVRHRMESRRWQVGWQANTPELRQACDDQMRRKRQEMPEAPEVVVMSVAKLVRPEKPRQARKPWKGAHTWA